MVDTCWGLPPDIKPIIGSWVSDSKTKNVEENKQQSTQETSATSSTFDGIGAWVASLVINGLECMFYNKCGRTACCLWYGCSDCDCSFAHVLYCSSEAPFVTIVLSFMYARLFMCSMLNHHLLWLWCSDYTFDRAATALWNSVRLIARYKAPVCTGSIRSVVQDFLYYWYFSLVAFAVQNIQLCTFACVVFCTGNLSQISI